MQTIDLGTISIGGEDVGAPAASDGMLSTAETIREDVTTEALFPTEKPDLFFSAEKPSGERCDEHREDTCGETCGEARPERGHGRTDGEEICFEKCEDYKQCRIGDASIEGQGRILDLTLRLRGVCPGKRVAVGVMLYELDARGHEHPRGLKAFTVSAHHHSRCADIPVETVRFILPEDSAPDTPGDACGCRRHFLVKVAAHYIDFCSAGATL